MKHVLCTNFADEVLRGQVLAIECSSKNQNTIFAHIKNKLARKRARGKILTAGELADFLVNIIYTHLRHVVPSFKEPCPKRPSELSVEAYVAAAFAKWKKLCCPLKKQFPVLVLDTIEMLPLMTNVPRTTTNTKKGECRTVAEQIAHVLPTGHGVVLVGSSRGGVASIVNDPTDIHVVPLPPLPALSVKSPANHSSEQGKVSMSTWIPPSHKKKKSPLRCVPSVNPL